VTEIDPRRRTLARTLAALTRATIAGGDYARGPEARWGWGSPPHPLLHDFLARRRDSYAAVLDEILAHEADLLAIPDMGPDDSLEPHWSNASFAGLDAAMLYTSIASRRPQLYLEVGSGRSTRFAARAVRDHDTATELVSIDACPRAGVEALASRIVREPLESVDLSVFGELVAGDVLLVEDSHRALQNSDVTVFFLEVLPQLPDGVLVGVEGIWLPADYPPEWRRLRYGEQYLLAAWLLGGSSRIDVVLPAAWISNDGASMARLFGSGLARVDPRGSTFWFETTPG
jgi:hypothetical protein